MIIDLILDRRDGAEYDPIEFAQQVGDYCEVFPEIARPILDALSKGVEQVVRHELCGYVLSNGYNPEICDYINGVEWLPVWWDCE